MLKHCLYKSDQCKQEVIYNTNSMIMVQYWIQCVYICHQGMWYHCYLHCAGVRYTCYNHHQPRSTLYLSLVCEARTYQNQPM